MSHEFIQKLVQVQKMWAELPEIDILNALEYYRWAILPNLYAGEHEFMEKVLNVIEFQTDTTLAKCLKCGKIFRPKENEIHCERCQL